MLQRKEWETAACPRCKTPVEDAEHIIRCPQPEANIVWTKALALFLEQWLVKQKTARQIITAILTGLQAWRSGTPANHSEYTLPGLQATVDRQDAIGWRGLLDSFPALGWAEVQHRYFLWSGSRRSGKRWLSAVIRKLWDVCWDLWDHRNKVLHKSDSSLASVLLHQNIRRELQLGSARLSNDAKIVFRQGRTILTANSDMGRAWLKRIRAARNFSTRSRQGNAGGRKLMHRWLGLQD